MKQLLSMAGIGLLGGLVIAGWMPRPGSSAVQAAPAVAQTAAYSENQPAVSNGAPQFRLVADRDDDDYYRNDWRGRDSHYRNNSRYRDNYGYNNGYYNNGYYNNGRYNDGYYGRRRSTGESVAIIGGGAAAGAAIGGLAKGGKGAAIGAIAGGVGGAIYDRATKYKRH